MMTQRFLLVGFALCFVLYQTQQTHAQRYLSEFVGTSSLTSNAATANLSASLEFDVQFNRVVDGTFALGSPSGLSNDNFNALGFLLPQDRCNVVLQRSTSAGGLRFIEIPFDANSFALIGRVNVSYLRSTSVIRAGRYNGSAAIVQPVANGVSILPENLGLIMAISDLTSVRSVHSFDITRQHPSLAVDGFVGGEGLLDGFRLTISSSPNWTYIVGHRGNRFLAMRVSSQLDRDGQLDAFIGDYVMYDESGVPVDMGEIAGD